MNSRATDQDASAVVVMHKQPSDSDKSTFALVEGIVDGLHAKTVYVEDLANDGSLVECLESDEAVNINLFLVQFR